MLLRLYGGSAAITKRSNFIASSLILWLFSLFTPPLKCSLNIRCGTGLHNSALIDCGFVAIVSMVSTCSPHVSPKSLFVSYRHASYFSIISLRSSCVRELGHFFERLPWFPQRRGMSCETHASNVFWLLPPSLSPEKLKHLMTGSTWSCPLHPFAADVGDY